MMTIKFSRRKKMQLFLWQSRKPLIHFVFLAAALALLFIVGGTDLLTVVSYIPLWLWISVTGMLIVLIVGLTID